MHGHTGKTRRKKNESQGFSKTYLREMQDHQETWQGHGHL